MVDKPQTVTLRGKAYYAKILGDPVPNYAKDGKEWKMDFLLTNAETLKELKKLGIGDRVKNKENYLDGKPFLTFKQAEFRKDGVTRNQPITVKDAAGNPWDASKLIGNDSDVDVKFAVIDYGPGKKKGVYIRSVRVLKLVSYERQEFEPLDENDEFYNEAQIAQNANANEYNEFKKDFGLADDELDDELPV